MPPLEQSEKDELLAHILRELSKTPYACDSLIQLTNGTTNFVFRGTLTQPLHLHLPNGLEEETATAIEATNTVIVKHSTEFAAVNKALPIDVSRCVVEESMLNALGSFHNTLTTVKVPHLYLFNKETNTQVLEDIPGVVDMKTILMSPTANDVLSHSLASSIGRTLGSWLRSYHSWASSPSQAALRTEIGDNEPMRKLKYHISYDTFINVLEQFPDVLGDYKKTLEDVKGIATKEFEKTPSDEEGEEWGIIHGDFWTGNILLPENIQQLEEGDTRLFVVDWEFAQFGHRSYDIGQMIGDLYERKHFKNVDGALWAIDAFIDAYGALSEEMAFRTAIHTGVQLITWMTRGPPFICVPPGPHGSELRL
ncbi:kinase-like domain-containing protein [Halenospora varia]|nr:kinase-like domain-containing protein [Halenospora varia]